MDDLTKLNKNELIKIIAKQQQELDKIKPQPKITSKDQEVVEIKDQISSLAKSNKLKAADVLEVVAKALKVRANFPKVTRAVAKYQHPDNPRKTWSGNNLEPKWVKAWKAEGKDLEDCRI